MTLLSIVQDAADEVRATQPATVAANTDPDVQVFLRLLNKSGKALMKSAAWQVLRKEQTLTTVSGLEQTGAIPSDFDRFVPETFWDRTNLRQIAGPITAVEWQGLVASSYTGTQRKFIYRGDSVFIIPAYSAGSTLAFEYVSQNWCQSSGGTGQTAFAADTDTGILDEELLTLSLIYAYLDSEGQPTAAKAERDLNNYLKTLLKNDQPNGGILTVADIFRGGRHFDGVPTITSVDAVFS